MWDAIGSGVYSEFEYVIRVNENSKPYIEITDYLGSSTNIVIPGKINVNGVDIPVTTIGSYAFDGCSSLTSITIPDSVTSIGNEAFSGCSNLANVSIGENSQLTTIGSYAFSNCSSLTSIIIPDSITTIGDGAFSNCDSLTSIIIPNSVTSMGRYVFYRCPNLTIYCEATSKPETWHAYWNISRPVVWGYING